MQQVYSTKPKITYYIENYHEITYYENDRLKTRTEVTNYESEEFNYMSSKDESNDLILGVYSNKYYIKLYIELVLKTLLMRRQEMSMRGKGIVLLINEGISI